MEAHTIPTTTDKPTTFVEGLRALADLLEQSDAAQSWDDYRHLIPCSSREGMAATIRKLGGKWEKSSTNGYLNLTRDLGGNVQICVYAAHANVCERVVSTETVTREIPDPELLADVPMVTVQETVEHVTWVCPDSVLEEAS